MPSIAINQSAYRNDSTVYPLVTASGLTGIGKIKIADWQYYPFINGTNPIIPPNRSLEVCLISLRDALLFSGNSSKTNVAVTGGDVWVKSPAGAGNHGAVYLTALNATKCSVEGGFRFTFGGISLQNTTAVLDPYNVNATHVLLFLSNGQIQIWERGSIVARNAYHRFEDWDKGLIELNNGIVRYYLVRSSGEMKLLRTTRSKISGQPYAVLLMPGSSSEAREVLVWNASEASTSFENIAVATKDVAEKADWQRWRDQRSKSSSADAIQMADNELQYTYPNSKRRLRQLTLTPLARTKEAYRIFDDFFEYHGNEKAFLFVDNARMDDYGTPQEFWAKCVSPLSDTTGNACRYELGVQVQETYRNDYVPKSFDLVGGNVLLDAWKTYNASTQNYEIWGEFTASNPASVANVTLFSGGSQWGAPHLPASFGTPFLIYDLNVGKHSSYTFYGRVLNTNNTTGYTNTVNVQ